MGPRLTRNRCQNLGNRQSIPSTVGEDTTPFRPPSKPTKTSALTTRGSPSFYILETYLFFRPQPPAECSSHRRTRSRVLTVELGDIIDVRSISLPFLRHVGPLDDSCENANQRERRVQIRRTTCPCRATTLHPRGGEKWVEIEGVKTLLVGFLHL